MSSESVNAAEVSNNDESQDNSSDNGSEEESMDDENNDVKLKNVSTDEEVPKKKRKKGIIYISSIPKHMNVTIAKEIFNQYADVGRVFFEPQKMPSDKNKNNKKRRRSRFFTEGWIEFESKRAAKRIAVQLNNTPIETRKGSKFYGILWNIKYLPRFKWIHLTERLTYEREVHKQKLRVEMSLARREATFFQENVDRSQKLKKQQKRKLKTQT